MKKSTAWRSLKIAGRLFGAAVVGYAVLLFFSIGTMNSQPRAITAIGDVVEAVVFFPQRFLPSPGKIGNEVHWFVCAAWMFALIYVPSLAYAAMTSKKDPIQPPVPTRGDGT